MNDEAVTPVIVAGAPLMNDESVTPVIVAGAPLMNDESVNGQKPQFYNGFLHILNFCLLLCLLGCWLVLVLSVGSCLRCWGAVGCMLGGPGGWLKGGSSQQTRFRGKGVEYDGLSCGCNRKITAS